MDAMQDVFVNFIQNNYQDSANAPSSLLYRMATNTCLNVIRSQQRRNTVIDNQSGDDILELIAGADNVEAKITANDVFERLFKRYPNSTKTIAVMYFHDGMTIDEIAQEINMSVSGVRKRLRALRETIKALREVSDDIV